MSITQFCSSLILIRSIVYEDVRAEFSEGTIIVGSYFLSSKERIIDTPSESNEYVEKRLKKVFGNV